MTGETSIYERLELTPNAARAHAMKNCLTTIMMTCTLIERKEAATTPKLWKGLRSASLRLRDLVAEQLAAEVANSLATSALRLDWCSVEGLTRSLAERLWARAENSGVRLAISCGGGELRCHEESLTEALVNLTANAIEATPFGGLVSVQTQETPDRDQLWVVKDAGCGFPDAQQAEWGRQPRSTKAGGWGLGVVLARVAIAHQGGVMNLASTPGEGTTITIWLPRQMRTLVEPISSK